MKRLKALIIFIPLIMCLSVCIFNYSITDNTSNELIDVCINLNSPSIVDIYNSKNDGEFIDYINLDSTQSKKDDLVLEQNLLLANLKKDFPEIEFLSSNVLLSNDIYCRIYNKNINNIKDNHIKRISPCNTFDACSVDESIIASSNKDEISEDGIFSFTQTEYSGQGMLIGIIDTGIDVDHDAFSKVPSGTVKYSGNNFLTDNIINSLNAKGTKNDFYRNQKVVYAYDYVGKDFDVSNVEYGSHGYHVAGIATGNNGKDFYGSSPNSQLAVFKVFPDGTQEGAEEGHIIAAIEDAITIGCDVINMSLGSVSSYLQDSSYQRAIDKARSLGISVVCANGNSGASTKWGYYDYSSSDMLDYGTAGSPAFEKGAFAVGNCFPSLEMMHDTSSWGCLPNMEIKPDITAPGTMIRSAVFNGKKNEYGLNTGTSMASPNIAGLMSNMLQYIKSNEDKFGKLTKLEQVNIAEFLLMSTANPIYSVNDDMFVSPRHQGSGVASIKEAVNARSYLTDKNGFRPKISVGEDKLRTGIYEFSFIVNNFSNETITYKVEGVTSTEKVDEEGKLLFAPEKLLSTFKFFDEISEVNNITIRPKENKVINVQVILDEEEKSKLNKTFKNGTYIDGRIFLIEGNESLTAPFLAFYGGYEEMNAFSSNGTGSPTLYFNDSLGNSVQMGKYNYEFNPYDYENKEEIDYLLTQDDNKNAISLDNTLNKIEFRVVRQISNLKIEIVNLDSGKVLKSYKNMGPVYTKWNVESAFYNKKFYQEFEIDFNIKDYPEITEGANLAIRFAGNLPYYPLRDCEYLLPFTIDSSNPNIDKINANGKDITFTAVDNHYLECYNILYVDNEKKEYLYENFKPFFIDYKGETVSVNEDISKFIDSDHKLGKVYIEVVDFAGNKTKQEISQKSGVEGYADVVERAAEFTLEYKLDKKIGNIFTDNLGGKYLVGQNGYILQEFTGDSTSYSVLEGTTSIISLGNNSLKQVILPSTLKNIENEAFIGSGSLEEVTFLSFEAPSIKGKTIFSTKPNIVVPYFNIGYNSLIYKELFNNISVVDIVAFDTDGGNYIGVLTGDNINVSNPVKPGYTFICWVDNLGNKVEKISANNQLLTAKYESTLGEVKFNFDGKNITKIYQVNQKIIMPEGFSKPFYKLDHYLVNGVKTNLDEDIYYTGGDFEVEGVYVKKSYSIKYIVGAQELTAIWKYGDELYSPTKEGYKFDGWYQDRDFNKAFTPNKDMNDELEVYAKFSKAEDNNSKNQVVPVYVSVLGTLGGIVVLIILIVIIKKHKRGKHEKK